MSDVLTLPVLPLDDTVVLPGMVVPVRLDAPDTRAAIDAATAAGDGDDDGRRVLVVPRLDGRYGAISVVAVLEQIGRLPNGDRAAVVRGERRARIGSGVSGPGAALWVEAEPVDSAGPTGRTHELATEYKALVVGILQQRGAWQVIDSVQQTSDPGQLADLAGWASWLDVAHKAELLAETDVTARLEKLLEWTKAHVAEQEVSEKISNDVREGMEQQQREFLLRQQLAAIRKELGEDDPDGEADYRARVEAADLPEHVRKAALAEVGKLERASDQSPESGWIRTWLDTVLDIPWNDTTEDSADLVEARRILDTDHAGLDDVKERLIEFLAVRARRNRRGTDTIGGRGSGAVLSLVGPPGVGKTSLGESVARSLGRKFVRVALGGVRDEAEIRGHRRTYVGALPGRIVRAIREAGSMNPVVLLDEIDKVGSDFRGDPTAALLEVLDPAQNHTFRDHYLEVDLDLSNVLFLATANDPSGIPGPLADRMEIVTLDGYTEPEKVAIARDHLLPRQVEKAGLDDGDVEFTDVALSMIAAEYTREAGVRQLERGLAKVLRKVAVQLDASDGSETVRPVHVDADALVTYLGRPRFTPESAERTSVPGVATGLAVTGAGGDVLFIEVTSMEGEPGLQITGQLGEVMTESVSIALSYLRSRGLAGDLAQGKLHVHVPAGAVPKDGPSAGVTMTTALASLASGRPVRSSVGMTGEVTLQGKVLPIGGVKQKLLAAHRAGLTDVIIPKRNEPDLDDVPESVRNELRVHPVADVAEVLEIALEPVDAQQHAA
ncbi:ATP-dependent protease La Type I [Pseudonocardia sp. Ae168_Ps1]|uniref:endopeptidase La n=1 Tax=unclassified Pseudonocardia TaxID=2619320 RepID=UPI000965A3E5|nr:MULTISPECIES: endopeptidase La [unclassified Pseudonocardia]OLL75444.1 ATP-dependent protease La Type I [Pseudonocardia sp. Ae150A_Ps1]OLL81440.1 ATP-dependent protease La Type I [Pseudonocardia sp. Ae168_Ps1]OLL84446.1 ATP-dependent protease La Type I [Pseudonocardia sp. Ae263_Ps1]OLL95534.1 ATP-dependent protease La Type I [Pseudonocardia sp. Ae356_Ps1]